CARYVVTDVRKDGTLQGPNVELLKSLAEKTEAPIVASGGVSSLDDLRALRELMPFGVDSAIVGKALYAGKLTLEEALDVAGRGTGEHARADGLGRSGLGRAGAQTQPVLRRQRTGRCRPARSTAAGRGLAPGRPGPPAGPRRPVRSPPVCADRAHGR